MQSISAFSAKVRKSFQQIYLIYYMTRHSYGHTTLASRHADVVGGNPRDSIRKGDTQKADKPAFLLMRSILGGVLHSQVLFLTHTSSSGR